MRLDKFLKVSRIIKRRTVANDMASAGRVSINGKQAKPSSNVAVGDVLTIGFGQGAISVRIKDIRPAVRKEEAADLYELIESGEKN
jgi:ribosomal 50S subunit-recycling heat shock protein